jgi:hypothetical protein
MEKTVLIIAYGHELIQSTHRTTFEITKDETLTKRGDCIIAVKSNKAAADLSRDFKEAAKNPDAEITVTVEAGEEKETVKATGDPRLSFTHTTDIVVRKSSYVCNRTIAVRASKAAADLSRKLIEKLQNPDQMVKITLTVRTPN